MSKLESELALVHLRLDMRSKRKLEQIEEVAVRAIMLSCVSGGTRPVRGKG